MRHPHEQLPQSHLPQQFAFPVVSFGVFFWLGIVFSPGFWSAPQRFKRADVRPLKTLQRDMLLRNAATPQSKCAGRSQALAE
jgi:hypothetical protein